MKMSHDIHLIVSKQFFFNISFKFQNTFTYFTKITPVISSLGIHDHYSENKKKS